MFEKINNLFKIVLPMSWLPSPMLAQQLEDENENSSSPDPASRVSKKSWNNTKFVLGAGLTTAAAAVSAYATYRFLQNQISESAVGFVGMDVVSVGEFQINTYTTNNQASSASTGLVNSKFFVAWESDGQDGDLYGVYGQCYDASGLPQGSEFRVNTYTTNSQRTPDTATLTNGDFVVTWISYGQDYADSYAGIFAQKYDSSCAPLGSEFQVNTYVVGDQSGTAVAALTNGNFIIAWSSQNQDGASYGIFAQLYSSSGTTINSEFQVNAYTTNSQDTPFIAALANDKFIIAWRSLVQDGYNSGVFAKFYSNDGVAIGSEFQVNTYTNGDQTDPSITALSNNNFVITWKGYGEISNTADIFAQLFDIDGTFIGGEIQVNTFSSYIQSHPLVAPLSTGGFIVSWTNYISQFGNNVDVYAKRYDNAGNVVKSDFQVNTHITALHYVTSITTLDNGTFLITWTSTGQDGSSDGVFAKLYTFAVELAGDTTDLYFIEKSNPIAINANLTILDATTNILGGEISLISNFKLGQDNLDYTDQNGITGFYNVTSGVLSLSGTATAADYQSALRNVTYFTNDDPGNLVRTVAVTVYDASATSNNLNRQINVTPVNEIPLLLNNSLTINEGQTITISTADLSASDVDNTDASLIFTVANTQQGQFELVSNPSVAITTFTQQQIIDSQVQFVHDGGEVGPSYEVSVSDGSLATTPASANINFTNINDAPVLENNSLTITEGQTKIVTSSDLSAMDIDNSFAELIFILTNVQHGQFELVSALNFAISNFTQQQTNNSDVRFVHDGGQLAPSYNVTVFDGMLSTQPASAAITFTNIVPPPPSPAPSPSPSPSSSLTNPNSILIVAGVGVVATLGAGAFFVARHFKGNKQSDQQWQAAPSKKELLASTKSSVSKKGQQQLTALISDGRKAYQQGQYEKAKNLHEKALIISQNIYGADHAETASIVNTLGVIYGDLNQPEKALNNLNEALRVRQIVFGDRHIELGKTYNNLGIVHLKQEQYQDAQNNFEKALQIFQSFPKSEAEGLANKVLVSLDSCKEMLSPSAVTPSY